MLNTTITHHGISYYAWRHTAGRHPEYDRGRRWRSSERHWHVDGLPGAFGSLEGASAAVEIDASARRAVEAM